MTHDTLVVVERTGAEDKPRLHRMKQSQVKWVPNDSGYVFLQWGTPVLYRFVDRMFNLCFTPHEAESREVGFTRI